MNILNALMDILNTLMDILNTLMVISNTSIDEVNTLIQGGLLLLIFLMRFTFFMLRPIVYSNK